MLLCQDNVEVKTCSTPIKKPSVPLFVILSIWKYDPVPILPTASIRVNLFSSSKAPRFLRYLFIFFCLLVSSFLSRSHLIEKWIPILTGNTLLEVGEKDERDFRHETLSNPAAVQSYPDPNQNDQNSFHCMICSVQIRCVSSLNLESSLMQWFTLPPRVFIRQQKWNLFEHLRVRSTGFLYAVRHIVIISVCPHTCCENLQPACNFPPMELCHVFFTAWVYPLFPLWVRKQLLPVYHAFLLKT